MATNQREQTSKTTGATSTLSGAASAVAEGAQSTLGKAGEMARDAASFVGRKAEDATSAVGSGIESLGGTIREKGPSSGFLGTAGSAVADTLETSGRYLQEHGLGGMAEDFTNTVRRYPVPAMLICIGIGFLLSRAVGR